MPVTFDAGHAFGMADLWQDVLSQQKPVDNALFGTIDTTLAPLEELKHDELFESVFKDTALNDGFDDLNLRANAHELDEEPAQEIDHHNFHHGVAGDIWQLQNDTEKESSLQLHTWEILHRRPVLGTTRTALLSESGPRTFDAALSSQKTAPNPPEVLSQDHTLRAVMNLVLGRSSNLFWWDQTKQCFVKMLDRVSISGISDLCSGDLINGCLRLGATTRKLRAFAEYLEPRTAPCAAIVALRSCTISILNATDDSIHRDLPSSDSLLNLQHLVAPVDRVLTIVHDLVDRARGYETDEGVICSISEDVHTLVQTEYRLCAVFRALLARVSAPWLELLAVEMGFGVARGADATSNASSASFLAKADCELIGETQAAINLLREIAPECILLSDTASTGKSCFEDIVRQTDSSPISSMVAAYEREATSWILGYTSGSALPLAKLSSREVILHEHQSWLDDAAQHKYLADSEAIMSGRLDVAPVNFVDSVSESVLGLLRDHDQGETTNDIFGLISSTELSPFEQTRPLVRLQNRLVNGVLLRELYRRHDLAGQLCLQREFHLFGNAEFVDRLSTALFSSDVQSAERRRGTVPTGQVMGLRLGSSHEERWPPASSELRLTLTGILNESRSITKALSSASNEASPGALSFAIRQLPEEEIDRVLDPNSIYALDFLRLHYTVDSPLDSVITTKCLEKYDSIFRFLLRLLRLKYVMTTLSRQISDGPRQKSALAFANQARHFVSVLLSHVMDIAISEPWTNMMDSVNRLSQTLHREDIEECIGTRTMMGLEGLRKLHEACLEQIRSRLFLKRKQEKLRSALETVLSTILEISFAVQSPDQDILFRKRVKAFHEVIQSFSTLLQQYAGKARTDTDDETYKILIARLNWNEFYAHDDQFIVA